MTNKASLENPGMKLFFLIDPISTLGWKWKLISVVDQEEAESKLELSQDISSRKGKENKINKYKNNAR